MVIASMEVPELPPVSPVTYPFVKPLFEKLVS
jgi:hypothetical protein